MRENATLPYVNGEYYIICFVKRKVCAWEPII